MGSVTHLAPSPAIDPALGALRARPIFFLAHYIRRHLPGFTLVFVSVVAAVGASVSTQYGLKTLIDVIAAGPDADGNVWGAFLLLVGFIAADNLLWRVGGFAAARSFVAVTGDIRHDLFAHLSGHSPSWFADRLPGSLAGRIATTANATFTIVTTGCWNVLPPIVAVAFSIAYIGAVNPLLAAVLVGLALAIGVVIFRLARAGAPLHRAYAERAAGVDGEFVDVIANMGVVRAFGATLRERRRLDARMGEEMRARRASLFYLEQLRLIHAVLTALLTAGVVAYGIVMWQHHHATVGDIVLLTSLAITILSASRDLAVALVALTQDLARLTEAIGAVLAPHDLPDRAGARPLADGPLGEGRGGVSFEAVRFAYAGRQAVLRGLDLVIRPGERVGLVGASGAGKSTVLSLLQRFHDVSGGTIRIDGQDIATVTQDSLRRTMAVVPQDIALFHRSVAENIRYARPEATEAEVIAAASAAHCRDFITALPEGFDTIVGDRGTKLSGGQRQRLAIARALLRDAPILLLDEATSALDSESEHAIQAALERLMRGRTVIAIAHRLSTLAHFDRIVVMDAGQIVDAGPPGELAARPGPYRELLRKQGMGQEAAAA